MTIITSKMYEYAINMVDKPVDHTQLMEVDFTEYFFMDLEYFVSRGSIIGININGRPREGKSTEGMVIGMYIKDLLIEYTNNRIPFGIRNIARDQVELSMKMRDDTLSDDIIVTDEFSESDDTGENITSEQALLKDFQHIQAARMIHKVYCSPKNQVDETCDIFLEVITTDKENYVTHNKLYYEIMHQGQPYKMFLGTVTIDVKKLVYNWINNVKPIFEKKDKTPHDVKYIQDERRKDFYVEYVCRKFEKFNLLNKEGIFRSRMLTYADIIMDVKNKLLALAKKGIINKNNITNYLKPVARKYKIPQSVLGVELMTRELDGILGLYKDLQKLNNEMIAVKAKLDKGKFTVEEFNKQREALEPVIQDLNEFIELQENEYKKLSKLKKQYYDT